LPVQGKDSPLWTTSCEPRHYRRPRQPFGVCHRLSRRRSTQSVLPRARGFDLQNNQTNPPGGGAVHGGGADFHQRSCVTCAGFCADQPNGFRVAQIALFPESGLMTQAITTDPLGILVSENLHLSVLRRCATGERDSDTEHELTGLAGHTHGLSQKRNALSCKSNPATSRFCDADVTFRERLQKTQRTVTQEEHV
jgi:hypothetical protein